ncbi:serine threonine protein kinase [Stylonychia lemnae]|uniref:dual-specificity kinase n=1 Tax=Stylonychia lemnae TaxID=5949 RepID=A0A078A3C2_STYLE|nr:serine threonine protein kinase [Stylonychia lemnae]|eukprot:CDW76667.1 serine threonine protein kinase [Stylonychia lemnae]
MQNKLKSPQNQSQKQNTSSSNIQSQRNILSGRSDRESITMGNGNMIQNQQSQYSSQNQGNYAPQTAHLPTTQSKVKKVLAFTLNQNINAAAYQSAQHSTSSNYQHNQSKKQEPSPQSKKSNQVVNRYESLQSKLKNKRRQTANGSGQQSLGISQQMLNSGGNGNIAVSTSTSAVYAKQSQQLQEAKLNSTQKFSANSYNMSQTGQSTQRKHLKLSVDNSDSSFNNMTIKSADKQNSIIRSIPQSTKNGDILLKQQQQQMTPTSNSGLINSSANLLYQSHFSTNSRFTTTRPVQIGSDQLQHSGLYQKVTDRQTNAASLLNSNSNGNLQMNQQQPYKSKFTLVNRPIDLAPQTSKEKHKKSFQFQTQQSISGADSFRKQTNLSTNQAQIQGQLLAQQQKQISSNGQPTGLMFSPKAVPGQQQQPQQYKTKNQLSSRGNQNQKSSNIESHRASIGAVQKHKLFLTSQDSILNSPDTAFSPVKEQPQQNNNLKNFMKDKPKPSEFKPPLNNQSVDAALQQHQHHKSLTNPQIQLQGSLIINEFNMKSKKSTNNGNNIDETIQEENHEESAQNTKRSSNSIPAEINQTNQAMESLESQPTISIEQHQQQQQMLEEQKKNQTLLALKEQLKAQINKQHQAFSNPQSISQIDATEVRYPISPGQALKLFLNNLTDYEKGEILNQKEVYFLGLNAQKIHGSPRLPHNYGYDDDRGDYQVVLRDHLAYRYEVLDFLGKGSFGQALKCYDYKTNQFVALKIIRNKKRFHHQAGVELKILQYLKDHDPDDVNNIIRIKDHCIFRQHLIISFELLNINLYEFIKNNNFRGISQGLIRRFAIQILQALKYQRDHGIIHCDLKPENILLKQPNKSGIKIIDYGSSCFQGQRIYTYIQSRFYRAPEIILGIPYSTAIDMWSFGCILAELHTGFPLFPGENEMEQLAFIMEIKGVPPDYILDISSRKKLFFDSEDQPIIVANSRGKKRRPNTKTLKAILQTSDNNFLNFIDRCLDWDPFNRMTPLEALHHEWILEGLPPKVLVHHQRMFGQKEDKAGIREATLTQIQGFPPDAESNTIFTSNKQKSSNAGASQQQQSKREEIQNITIEQQEVQIVPSSQVQSDLVQTQQNYQAQAFIVNQTGSSQSQTGQKKNRTIQLFMQEMFDEKAPSSEDVNQNQFFAPQLQIEPQTFYGHQKQSFKSSTQNIGKIKEYDQQVTITYEGSAVDEDMEEGAHFSQTQKIPISLIKQQDKVVTPNQNVHQQFYNPKQGGPKLNNYLTQANQNKHSGSNAQFNFGGKKQSHGGSFHKAHQSSGIDLLASARNTNRTNQQQKSNNNSHHQQVTLLCLQIFYRVSTKQDVKQNAYTLKQITSQRTVGYGTDQVNMNVQMQPAQQHQTQSIKIDLASSQFSSSANSTNK